MPPKEGYRTFVPWGRGGRGSDGCDTVGGLAAFPLLLLWRMGRPQSPHAFTFSADGEPESEEPTGISVGCVCVRAGGGGGRVVIEDEKAYQLVHLGVHTGLSFQGEIVSIACPQTVGKFVCLVEAGLLCLSKWLLLPIGIPSLPACFTFSHSQDSKVRRMEDAHHRRCG